MLIALCEARYGTSEDDKTDTRNNVIVYKLSADNGHTWTEMYQLNPDDMTASHNNVCTVWDKFENRLVAIYQKYNNNKTLSNCLTAQTDQQTYVMYGTPSVDENNNPHIEWTTPTCVTNNSDAYPNVSIKNDDNVYGVFMAGPNKGICVEYPGTVLNLKGNIAFGGSVLFSGGAEHPALLMYRKDTSEWQLSCNKIYTEHDETGIIEASNDKNTPNLLLISRNKEADADKIRRFTGATYNMLCNSGMQQTQGLYEKCIPIPSNKCQAASLTFGTRNYNYTVNKNCIITCPNSLDYDASDPYKTGRKNGTAYVIPMDALTRVLLTGNHEQPASELVSRQLSSNTQTGFGYSATDQLPDLNEAGYLNTCVRTAI